MGVFIKDLVVRPISENDYMVIDNEDGTYKAPANSITDKMKADMSNISNEGITNLRTIVSNALGLSVVDGKLCVTFEGE